MSKIRNVNKSTHATCPLHPVRPYQAKDRDEETLDE